ncbi:MAG: HAMP domain-containing protein [Deltaproteobacteria bacterium]|nr:HAMP domain-containing protein [Deltaproteobacteria bacterium]
MKKKLFLIALLSCLLFTVFGAYIGVKIQGGTSALDRVIRLHRIELLREGLYSNIKVVQETLQTKDTRFFAGPDALVRDTLRMEAATRHCFDCHHSAETTARLTALSESVARYEAALSRVLTMRANAERLVGEEDEAFKVGASLLDQVHDMLSLTSSRLQQRTYETIDTIRRTNLVLFSLMAAGPLLIIGLSVYFVRFFSRPVGALLEATRRLKSGDLDHRVAGLEDEFGELGTSFNEMAQSLREQMAQLQRADQMMVCGQLATGIAHEIRNPVAAIKVTLQVLADDLDLTEEDRGLFGKVTEEAARIETLMKDLLEYARPREPRRQTVDVNELLDKANLLAVQHRPSVRRADGEVRWVNHLDPGLPKTIGDPDQLFQVFVNIVLNGLDAMPGGGTLTVRTTQDGGFLCVEISDQGPGVDPAIRDKIFEPFFTRKAKGTGLGLAISKVLIEKHGGTIGVTEAAGGGACFFVRLPAAVQEESP